MLNIFWFLIFHILLRDFSKYFARVGLHIIGNVLLLDIWLFLMSLEGEATVIINNLIISITFFWLFDIFRIFIKIQIFSLCNIFTIPITILFRITRVGLRFITDIFLHMLLAVFLSLEGEASEFFFDHLIEITLISVFFCFLLNSWIF